MIEILTIETPSLGDRSYLATDGSVAVVVDPQRDLDRVLDLVAERGLRITHVLETHVHNDYVTGGPALAQQVGARYAVNAQDELAVDRLGLSDGDVLTTGDLRITALATPGHTFTHLSYAVAGPDGQVVAVFTGGSLLYGSVGRPDLLGPEHTDTLARHQHASVRRLVAELPAQAEVYPTHGFGSFCSATQSDATSSTVGRQARENPALTSEEEQFVAELLAGLDVFPAYYAHMAPTNAQGPSAADLSPVELADPAVLRSRIEAGEWVVDLRTRSAFAAGHLPGSVNFGLDGPFVTYLGWSIPWGTPVTLLAASEQDIAGAQRDLARIGIDRPAGAATGSPQDWAGGAELSSFATSDFAGLARALDDASAEDGPLVLDVRRPAEHAQGHIAGAVSVPLHELPRRVAELPTGRTVWVHCAGGYRASVAASFLDRAGYDVVAVDDPYDNAAPAGLETTA